MRRKRVPAVVRVANCQDVAVSSSRAASNVVRALTSPGYYGLPDLVLFSEIATVDLWRVAERHGFTGLQMGSVGSPYAGVGLAVRDETAVRAHRDRLVVGSPATSAGGGIRMRPLVSDLVSVRGSKWVRVWSGHAPPPRAPLARLRYLAAVRGQQGIVGADFNLPPAEMRARYLRVYHGIGVLGLLTPARYDASIARPLDIGSDHDAADIRIHLPARRKP